MERRIVVYGHPDKRPVLGFPTESAIQQWITDEVFAKYRGRYHHTLGMEADIILLSRNGRVHGHFEIESKVKPDETDYLNYPDLKFVYAVRSSTVYENPVRLSELGIKGIQFGKAITEAQFTQIKSAAGGMKDCRH